MSKVIDLDEIERLEYEQETAHYKQVKSKTSIKKDTLEITDFGRALVSLSSQQLDKLPLPENIRDNIDLAKNMQKIALKRQTQFIGKLLRKIDNIEEVQKAYDVIMNKDKQINSLFSRLENIRDNLVDTNKTNDALEKLIEDKPELDVQKMRQLIRNHHKEVEKNKPKKSYRELFKLLKDLYANNS